MKRLYLSLCLFISASQAAELNTDIMAKALSGNIDARLEVARILNDPASTMYYPDKAHKLYLELARAGVQEAIYPLAEQFADPDSQYYSPARAVTYLSKLPDTPAGQLLFYEVLAYRTPISRINIEISNRSIGPSDPYFKMLKAFSYFPFEQASPGQREAILKVIHDAVAAPFRAYMYPSLAVPTAGDMHLLAVGRDILEGNPLPATTWYTDALSERVMPLMDSKGVRWVASHSEPDEWRGERMAGLEIGYPLEAFDALQTYFAGMMEADEDGFRAPGVFVRVKQDGAGDEALVEFIFTPLTPLIRPSRDLLTAKERNAMPRAIFSTTLTTSGE